MTRKNPKTHREILKSCVPDYDEKAISGIGTGVPQPAVQEPCPDGALIIDLPIIDEASSPKMSFFECASKRCSRRIYIEKPLTVFELAFLLWCTQGIKKVIPGFRKHMPDGTGRNYIRPVPNVYNPFETYVAILNVENLEQGAYRYLPLDHKLVFLRKIDNIAEKVAGSFRNVMQTQDYTMKAGAIFYWTCLPHRAKWRNKDTYAKNVLLEMGHISQNFYLATEALSCGAVVISGYIQDKADRLVGVDGESEFMTHCASVGHIDQEKSDVYDHLPDLRFS